MQIVNVLVKVDRHVLLRHVGFSQCLTQFSHVVLDDLNPPLLVPYRIDVLGKA